MFSKKLSVLMFCALLAGCASDEVGDTNPTTPPPANEPEPSGPAVPDQISALLDPTALCAIPTLGPALVSAAGSSCDDAGGGGGGSPTDMLDPAAFCAIPGIGPQLASAAGASCGGGDGGSGGDSPLPVGPDQLCAIPTLGPQLASALGATCGAVVVVVAAHLHFLSN